MLAKVSYVLATLLLARRLPSLYRYSSPSGSKAAILLLLLAIVRPYEQNTKLTLVGTGLGLAWSYFKQSVFPLRWIVTLGAAPVVAEAIRLGDADIPAVLAMVLGLFLDQVSAASVILIMVTGGEALEDEALDRAGASLHSLLERSPGMAMLENGTTVAANVVSPGTLVQVRNLEVFPVDGYLVSPESGVLVDERLLTGECIPRLKVPGELILAGTVNQHNASVVWTKAKGGYKESILNQMQLSLADALEKKKSQLELLSTKLADGMTPFTVLLAALAFEFHSWKGQSTKVCWETVLSILMSATPCPARIGVPIAMLSGMNVSSRVLGTTLKSGDALEKLTQCKVLCLDKTGTVTTGKPVLAKCTMLGQIEQDDTAIAMALDLLANLETMAPKHVLADALIGKRLHHRTVSQVESHPGQGVRGVVDGKFVIQIGSLKFVAPPAVFLASVDVPNHHLVSYFSINQTQYGVLEFHDPIRPETRELVDVCRNRYGMTVVLLSGDGSQHLAYCAKQLGVERFVTCLPHEKVLEIRKLQQQVGKVVMIGDGANDSAALAAADVGVSLDPSTMASESAQIVVLNGDIGRVKELIRLSHHVFHVAKTTVLAGMAASGVQMLLAAGGNSDPFINAVMQEVVDLTSVLHSLRALSFE
ncbi:hypothetical protein BASA81_001181 [Batrachochytrium salamandrivorans]|nr:hypothetical protein BASA81_001181 [Batrachochytrium salamandrivorans]